MDIGTGIAIAGIWVSVGMFGLSKYGDSNIDVMAIFFAFIATLIIF